MSGLDKLTVSLTKNGFQKIADLIIKYPRAEILNNINGGESGISLDRAQVVNMLSGDPASGDLPEVWDEIREFEDGQIRALTFIAILYSHKKLIEVFSASIKGEMRGVLYRKDLDEKTYTNVVYTMQSFGICRSKQGADFVDFTLTPIFADMRIGPLAKFVIGKKLEKTGWKAPAEEDEFHRNFYEQCFFFKFHKALGLSTTQFESWLEGQIVEVTSPQPMTLPETTISVSAKLVAALAAKPFAILCGASGTGKTTCIRQLVSSLSPEGVERRTNHAFISVEAGWTDGRHLLGYKNPFGGNGEYYAWTPIIDVLLRANYVSYQDIPFFIILDEMNLSYVEMYFSKFLSIMETSMSDTSEPLLDREALLLMLRSGMLDPEQASMTEAAIKKGGLFLSTNVFIVGTVNIDETTHSFSPKVLDRAFVIEVEVEKPSLHGASYQIPADDLLTMPAKEVAALLINKSQHVAVADDGFTAFLDAVFACCGAFKFGPRVTREMRRYQAVTHTIAQKKACPPNFAIANTIRDRLLMQKVLPKFSGNRAQLGRVLDALLALPEIGDLPATQSKLAAMKAVMGPLGAVSFFS